MVKDLKHEEVTVGVFEIRDGAIYFEPKSTIDIDSNIFSDAKNKLKEKGYALSWDARGCLTVHTEDVESIKELVAEAYYSYFEGYDE